MKKTALSGTYPVWILLERIEGEEEWTAHCLELDIVSQGSSAQHAYDMGVEAVKLAMQWDMEEGLDPRARVAAPGKCFETLHELQKRAKLRPNVSEALEEASSVLAVRVTFDLEKVGRDLGGPDDDKPEVVGMLKAS